MTYLTDGEVSVIVQLLFWDYPNNEYKDHAADFFNARDDVQDDIVHVQDVREALAYAFDWAVGRGDFSQDGFFSLGDRSVEFREVCLNE